MKVEYEWHAVDERGRREMIAEPQKLKRPWWFWTLLGLLVGVVGAALVYSGYVAFS